MPPKRVKKKGKKGVAAQYNVDPAQFADLSEEERTTRAEAAKTAGNTAFLAGDAAAAVASFSEAIALVPTNQVFWSNRSAAFLTMGEVEAAMADANKCVEIAPEWSKGYGRIGSCFQALGEHAKAIKAFTDGLTKDASSQQLADGLASAQAGMQAAEEFRHDDSIDVNARRKEIEANIKRARADRANLESGVATCVGIDLGTTYSCVGVWRDGGVEIIANSEGNRTTPSWVSFSANGERLIGEAAKTAAAGNATNTVFDAKRIIGQRFSDSHVQSDAARFPFAVVCGDDNKPMIEVTVEGQTRRFAPEEISAMVLGRMRDTAEAFMGTEVRSAVVTVPAYFSDAQRQATKNAGTIAGLEVKRIINEPTAAALAYGLDANAAAAAAAAAGEAKAPEDGPTHVLIFDLGGGTFDVSLLSINSGIFEVLATGGDTHLGGEDFDSNLVDFCVTDFQRKNRGLEITSSARSMRRLRAACENAKRMLSTSSTASIDLEALFEGADYSTTISRAKFEALNQEAFDRTLDTVRAVLADAKMSGDAVSDVVLVGGSTRIPKIQAMLSELFEGKELCRSINPDEAVAYGAAVQGAILSGVRSAETNSVLLVDVTPLSLGIELTGRVMSTLIKRNTAIPVRKTKTYTTEEDWQTSVDICVFEGERASTDANNKLGEFRISGLERARRGVPQVEVTFDIDANGIMTVSARDTTTGATAETTISNSGGRLSQAEIDRMVAEAAEFKAADSALMRQVEARNDLEHLVYSTMELARESEDPAAEAECIEIRDWLADNEDASVAEMNSKRRNLERLSRGGRRN